MSNEATLIVLLLFWLLSGRGLNLCFLICCYYAAFLLVDITELNGFFFTDSETVIGTYVIQCSLDSLALLSIIYLSSIYHNSKRIYFTYGAIIATSLVLNGLMLYDQMLDLSMVYEAHAIRQEFSIPLDVLFAVLGSAYSGQFNFNGSLRTGHNSNYNRFNGDY
jgi:hypothetical protein